MRVVNVPHHDQRQRQRLKKVSIKMPGTTMPVVECPRAGCYFETRTAQAWSPKRKPTEDFWSNTAVVAFDMSSSESQEESRESSKSAEDADSREAESLSRELSLDKGCQLLVPGDPCHTVDLCMEDATHGIVLFLPSTSGASRPSSHDDHGALFEAAAIEISECPAVDCYQLSWPHSNPTTDHAVECVLYHLQEAISKVQSSHEDPNKCPNHFQVILIGYAFGGAVATQAASELGWLFSRNKYRNASVTIEGLCAINPTAYWGKAAHLEMTRLQNVRALLVANKQDHFADLAAARQLFAMLPATRKEMLMIPDDDGTHRGQLLLKLVGFVLRGLLKE